MKLIPPLLLCGLCKCAAFTPTPITSISLFSSSDASLMAKPPIGLKNSRSEKQKSIVTQLASVETNNDIEDDIMTRKKKERLARIKDVGGSLAFPTPYGALNPYGIFYGLTAIGLGIFWWFELMACKILYFLTRNRVDKNRRLPIFLSHVWGTLLMKFTRAKPEYVNREILQDLYKSNRAVMFVANHNSWQDIPYLGSTIGWRNYKIVAKQELLKVPILSTAIATGGHVIIDRTSRKSQLMTLKNGINLLKGGVHLCTFPEGTRSKSGHLNKFKNGAFKMAHKAGAPVVPLSIVASGKIMPVDFMFPIKKSKGIAKVVIHDPIESIGKTEEELAEAARNAIISGLPEDQRPIN